MGYILLNKYNMLAANVIVYPLYDACCALMVLAIVFKNRSTPKLLLIADDSTKVGGEFTKKFKILCKYLNCAIYKTDYYQITQNAAI